MTYWFDDERKTAICLIEAPDTQHIIDMHAGAHGDIPHRVIEVDSNIVESFLGRIEDPKKSKNTSLSIINDPAFRTIMIVNINSDLLSGIKNHSTNIQEEIIEIITNKKGRVVKQRKDYILVSFDSVSNAVFCAKEVSDNNFTSTKISLNSGVPVTDTNSIFEDTIKLAENLYLTKSKDIVMTSNVHDLYMSENSNKSKITKSMTIISEPEEIFITDFMDLIDAKWRETDLKVEEFSIQLGISKSQLYRKMIALFGISPNSFLKNYRLNKAKELLSRQVKNISEIAFETGFSSPSYFSKCFLKKFGIKPSDFFE